MKKALRNMAFILVLFASYAFSCPDGYYDQWGVCLPNSGTVAKAVPPAMNPLPDTLNVLGAAVKGDIKGLEKAIGGVILKGTCPGCDVLLTLSSDAEGKAFIQSAVGRGWLLFMATGDPVLVVVDAAATTANRVELKQTPAAGAPVVKPRGNKVFQAGPAQCIVKHSDGSVVVGWAKPPVFKDAESGEVYVYPEVDLLEADKVAVASTDDCPNVPPGQEKLKIVTVRYKYSTVSPGTGTVMKFFVVGKFES